MNVFKASLTLALGYLLFYAAVANGGQDATQPWAVLKQ